MTSSGFTRNMVHGCEDWSDVGMLVMEVDQTSYYGENFLVTENNDKVSLSNDNACSYMCNVGVANCNIH